MNNRQSTPGTAMTQEQHFLFFAEQITDTHITLSEEEAFHAFTVLRYSSGTLIAVTDGKGSLYTGIVEECTKRSCTARIVKKITHPVPKPAIHFFLGMPEKDAFEAALDGLVPLGITTIVPVVCAYSQKRWWDTQWEKQSARFYKKMVVAAKQSWNTWVPKLNPPTGFFEALDLIQGQPITADENGLPLMALSSIRPVPENVSCFIGPPGGFAPEEIDRLQSRNSVLLKLSRFRLRTELAATALAVNIVQHFVLSEDSTPSV